MQHSADLSAYWLRIACAVGLLFQVSANASIESTASSPVALEVELQLEEMMRSSALLTEHVLQQPDHVHTFYIARNYRPAWHDQQRLLPHTDHFLQYAKRAPLKGLFTTGLQLDVIDRLRDNLSAFDKARLDILLTDAFMTLSMQAARGSLDPLAVDRQWHYQRPEIDVVSLLSDALKTHDIAERLDALLPRDKSYHQLVSALAFYRYLADRGDWPKLARHGPQLKLGMRSDELGVLRERLRLTGDLSVDATAVDLFDTELDKAVRHFQKRHGLAVDGIIGRKTRQALNVPVDQRIRQILLNLERWRWLPRELGERHIRIDMAGFKLSVHDKNDISLSMRVIVGRNSRKTPLFTSDIDHLILNPYWNVPELIAKRDLMPRILRDPKYLARQRIRVLRGYGQHEQELDSGSIDWSLYRNATELPFRFRQDPGVSNSMGQIKFVLPNPFAILLHDTPSKHLFNQSVRAYSSGCIRVEDPLALADYVMGDTWEQGDFRKIMDKRQSAVLTLPRPIPVHMLYMTAWAEPNGSVQFRQDVYGWDGPLLAAIRKSGQPEPVEKVDTGPNKVETLARAGDRPLPQR